MTLETYREVHLTFSRKCEQDEGYLKNCYTCIETLQQQLDSAMHSLDYLLEPNTENKNDKPEQAAQKIAILRLAIAEIERKRDGRAQLYAEHTTRRDFAADQVRRFGGEA